jgi:hypothetical protein
MHPRTWAWLSWLSWLSWPVALHLHTCDNGRGRRHDAGGRVRVIPLVARLQAALCPPLSPLCSQRRVSIEVNSRAA